MNETPSTARASALVFSGQPDPEWPLAPAQTAALETLWAGLAAGADPGPEPPALGYRGVWARDGRSGEWRAFGCTVTRHDARGAERRGDTERKFERAVLATAPPGLLPHLPGD